MKDLSKALRAKLFQPVQRAFLLEATFIDRCDEGVKLDLSDAAAVHYIYQFPVFIKAGGRFGHLSLTAHRGRNMKSTHKLYCRLKLHPL